MTKIQLNTKAWKYQKLLGETKAKVFMEEDLKNELEKIKAKRYPTLFQKINLSGFRSGKHLVTLLSEEFGKGINLILTKNESKIDGINIFISFYLYDRLVQKNFFPLYTELGFTTATEFLVAVLGLKIKPFQRSPKQNQVNNFITTLPISGKKLSAKKTNELVENVTKVIKQADTDSKTLQPEVLKASDAAIRQTFYKSEIKKVSDVIDGNFKSENKKKSWENSNYKPWFLNNDWIFGIEYKGLLDKSRFTVECTIDLGLETYDGYIDVIEVKTPNVEIFEFDNSRKTYFPSTELSKAISQAIKYIHCLESEQNTINVKAFSKNQGKRKQNPPLVLKPRVKVVIGHKKMWNHAEATEKFKTLKLINDGLNNIHIYTFDQILEIGNKMIKNYEK